MANEKLKTALSKARTLLKPQDQELINALNVISKACDVVPEIELSSKVEEAIKRIENLFKQKTN